MRLSAKVVCFECGRSPGENYLCTTCRRIDARRSVRFGFLEFTISALIIVIVVFYALMVTL